MCRNPVVYYLSKTQKTAKLVPLMSKDDRETDRDEEHSEGLSFEETDFGKCLCILGMCDC